MYKQDTAPGRLQEMWECHLFHGASFLFLSHLQGVCLGMQLAVVEFSRNVLGWQGKCLLKNFLHPWRAQSLVPIGSLGAVEKDRPARALSTSWGALTGMFIEGKQGLLQAKPQEGGSPAEQALCPSTSCSGDPHTLSPWPLPSPSVQRENSGLCEAVQFLWTWAG